MITIEELKEIKARMQREIGIRKTGFAAGKISVGFGEEDKTAGASDIVHAFMEALDKSGVYDVAVIQDGSLSFADKAPGADIEFVGKKMRCTNLTPEKAAGIVEEYVKTEKAAGQAPEAGK